MKIAVLSITRGGRDLALRLAGLGDDVTLLERKEGEKTAALLAANWTGFDGFVCVMAAGIVVRAIAPLLGGKRSDPCVVVVDERGRHAISLLSGHLGGGNLLAERVAERLGGTAVITTASDSLGLVPLDLWAESQGLTAAAPQVLTDLAARLVDRRKLRVFTDLPVSSLPAGLVRTEMLAEADLVIGHSPVPGGGQPVLAPCNLVVGVGCNRGTPKHEFDTALDQLCSEAHLSPAWVRNLASIAQKSDETGLLEFAASHGWPIDFFDREAINGLTNLEISFAALKAVGAIGVAEPAALLSAKSNQLLSRKRKWKNVTMAVARAPFTLSAQVRGRHAI